MKSIFSFNRRAMEKGMLFLIIFVMGCADSTVNDKKEESSQSSPKQMQVQEDSFCRQDSECIILSNRCGCRHGGGRIATDKKTHEKRKQNSGRVICPAVISKHWSCGAVTARCINQKCVLLSK